MAKKTIDHMDFYVAIKPYKTEGNGDQVFDSLRVSVGYRKGSGFYVGYHPGWGDERMWGCLFDFSKNPLTAGGSIGVEPATKNNSKRIAEMHAALELAKEGISLYFDKRLFEQLNNFMKYVAIYGFTPHYQQEVARLKEATDVAPVMQQYNDLKKQKPDSLLLFRCGDFYEAYEQDALDVVKILDTALSKSRATGNAYDMVGFPQYALDAYLPKLVRAGKRVAICDQIADQKTIAKATSNINNNKEDKAMKSEETIENMNVQNAAQVSNVNTGVDVAEVNDIMPKVTKKSLPPTPPEGKGDKPAVTIPLGKHGTLVIAGVGEEKPTAKSQEPKANKPEAKVQDSVPQVRLVIYTTKRGDQAPRIDGFGGENDPRWKRHYDEKIRLAKEKKEADAFNENLTEKMKGKPKAEREKLRKQWKSVGSDPFGASYFTDRTTGEKFYQMTMGAKYLDVARELVDAYNSGDETAIAAAEQAVIDCKNGIVKDIEAQRDAKRAEREARKSEEGKVNSEEGLARRPEGESQSATAQPAMDAKEQAIFELFKKFMAGDADAMAQVNAMVAKQVA